MVPEVWLHSARSTCLAALVVLAGCSAPDEPLNATAQALDSYVFKKRPAPLVATDAQPYEHFGSAIGVSSLWAAVGSPGHDLDPSNPDDDTGSATVFQRQQGNVWEAFAHLAPERSYPDAHFGSAIAATDAHILLGSGDADPSSDGSKWGAGLVAPFAYDAGTWQAEPLLHDPHEDADRYFGSALAIDGETLLVGAYGADQAFIFSHGAGGWSAPITVDSPSPAGGGFGFSVALHEPFAFIGAPFDDQGGEEADDQGAVFVYEHEGAEWTFRGQLERDSSARGDLFGAALAAKDGLVVATAYGDLSVVAFELDASSRAWVNPQRLVPANTPAMADFGRATAIGVKNSIWVGAAFEEELKGVVYPFIRSGHGWDQDASLSFEDSGLFGFAMASASGALMVGAPDAGDAEQGAVYVIETSDGTSCTSDDDCFSAHCVRGICCNSLCDQGCYSCFAAEKASGSADGTCGPVRRGAKPSNEECVDHGAESCDTNGLCDGEGACQKYAEGTQCAAPFCSGNDVVGAALCDGQGNCAVPEPSACGSYACDADACQSGCSKDTDCAADFYCGDGRCRAKLGLGAPCDSSTACRQGFCTDGVCCDSACDGACESCTEEGSSGVCQPKSAGTAPRGAAAPKGVAPVACDALWCDGTRRDAASMLTAKTTPCSLAGCVDGVEVAEGRCDGDGSCVAPTMKTCGAYACSSTQSVRGRPEQCLTSCDSVSDCAPEHYCTTDHECRPVTGGGTHQSQGCSVSSATDTSYRACFPLLLSALGVFGALRRASRKVPS